MPGGRAGAALVTGPRAIDVDEVDAPSRIGPSARHAFQGRPGYVEDRQDRARHLGRIELAHDRLYRVHRAYLVAVHTADEDDALARPRPPGDHHGHIPVLPGGHLHALEIEGVLFARFQVIDVEPAHDPFSLDHVARVGRSSTGTPCRARRGCRRARAVAAPELAANAAGAPAVVRAAVMKSRRSRPSLGSFDTARVLGIAAQMHGLLSRAMSSTPGPGSMK